MSLHRESLDPDSENEPSVAAAAIHDLRGAIHAIQGFVSVLLSEGPGPLTPPQKDFLLSVNLSARRIARLVEDLQVLEFGLQQVPLMLEECELTEVLQICMRELQLTSDAFDVAVHLDLDRRLHRPLIADPVRLEQIIFNLLENAIRYAPPGSMVLVRLRESASRVLLIFENDITDPSAADSATWFKMFHRGDHGVQQRRGFGVGLIVVQALTEAHGGRVMSRLQNARVSIAAVIPRLRPSVPESAEHS
jgi:signal transduction histidine kinase